jgi:hypothetical protein
VLRRGCEPPGIVIGLPRFVIVALRVVTRWLVSALRNRTNLQTA